MIKTNLNLPSFLRKGLFNKKSVRFFFDVLITFIGIVSLIIVLLLGRLSLGPINLDFLTPEIESALDSPQNRFSATIEHTQLAWHKWYRPFEIELVDVCLKKDQNLEWIKIDHIGISLSLPKLLLGDLSLSGIRIYRPQIFLERDEKGHFLLGLDHNTPNQEFDLQDIIPFLTLDGPTSSLGKLNSLNKISIIDAHVMFKDNLQNQTWILPKTSIDLKRFRNGFSGQLTLQPQSKTGSLVFSVSHVLNSHRIDCKTKFVHIALDSLFESTESPSSMPATEFSILDDLLNYFQCSSVPLNGKIRMAFDPTNLAIISGRGDVDLGKGILDLSVTKFKPLSIHSGNISFSLSPSNFQLERFSILSDEMLFNLAGDLDFSAPKTFSNLSDPGLQVNLLGKVEDLALDQIGALWPEDIGRHARNWITKNLRQGIISEATFSLKGHTEEQGFIIDTLQGQIEGDDAEVTYLEGLPPIKNVHADATFDSKGFDIKINKGNHESITVEDAHILIKDLDTDNESLSLNLKASGSLSDILDVLDHKPLEYASYGGIDPKKVQGAGEMTLEMNFPLLTDLGFKDVKMKGKGTFTDIGIDRKVTNELSAQLKNGALDVEFNQDKMVIKGKGVVNQLPSTLSYEHFFTKNSPYELQIMVDVSTNFEDFKRFGFDTGDYGKGPTNTKLTYTLEKGKTSHFSVDLDVTPSTITIAPLGLLKKPGEQSRISFSLLFNNGQFSKLGNLKMDIPPYSIHGDIDFDSNKNWKSVILSEFKGPNMNTQASFKRSRENAYQISFNGESVDLENFLKYLDEQKEDTHTKPIDIQLKADVGQLRLGENKIFDNVKSEVHLILEGKEKNWQSVHLRAKVGKGMANKGDMAQVSGGILFDIKPGPNNSQTLEVRANDAGKFLKNLSIYEKIHGGYLTIKATRQGKGPFEGTFKIKDFEAKSVPLLARFAAVLSPMGIVNLFSEKQTLSMERFECDFSYSEELITLKKGIGKSLSLGFTADGKLDRIKQLYSLKGNVIPARFINAVLNNIPLIGSLLNGGDGQGLFAVSYTVKGKFEAPEVSVNPLSALAPGFIRNLFQSDDTD